MECQNGQAVSFDNQIIDLNSHILPTPSQLINDNCYVGQKECEAKDAELNISTVVDESVGQNISSTPSIERVRWKNEHDVPLYKSFLHLINQNGLTIDDFKAPIEYVLNRHMHIIRQLAKSINWKGTAAACLNRLQKMLIKSGFSYRESRKLKKMLKLVDKNKMTMEQVIEQFPGRSYEMIQQFKSQLQANN